MSQSTAAVAADPSQKYWDVGLKSFQDGQPATAAMQAIWEAMMPPANPKLLAAIVGALYADTYWRTTRLRSDLLSSDLQAALGLNKADCDAAATYAFQSWYGLLVRANMADAGNAVPRPDPVTASPDVVVNGAAPLTVPQIIRQWNVYNYTPKPGLKNYTYGRAASVNLRVPIEKPFIRMFFSDAGFNPPPRSWIQQYTWEGKATAPLQNMESKSTLNPGERGANADPFAFNPPGTGHYCLIAIAGTEYFTNDPLASGGNWDTQEWVHYNCAAGWHNVDVAKSNSAGLKFYNHDGLPERFEFEAHCRNLPAGTVVTLQCEAAGLSSRIAAHSGKITRPFAVVRTETELPPNFGGDLQVAFDIPGGKPLPANASIDVQMHWVLPHNHMRYRDALAQLNDTDSGALGRAVRLPMGNFTFIGA